MPDLHPLKSLYSGLYALHIYYPHNNFSDIRFLTFLVLLSEYYASTVDPFLANLNIGQIFQIEEVLKVALQDDCRHYVPGIEILSVHVTKPVIPNSIRRSFELMEEERIKVLEVH